MSGERVIDLDEPQAGAADRRDARRTVTRKVAAAFGAGLVLGAAGVFALPALRAGEVSIVAMPALVSGGASDVDGIYRVEGQLAVVNTGSVPVTVRLLGGDGPGVMVRDAGPAPEIRPGGTAWIGVKIRVVCAVGLGTAEVPLRLSAAVEGGEPEESGYPIAFLNSAWGNESLAGCVQTTP